MSDIVIPNEYICPISQDIMNNPIEVIHHRKSYFFDKDYITIWKHTIGGDKNPLTMLSGFREAPIINAKKLKQLIDIFKRIHNIKEEKQDLPKLTPYTNDEQILEDNIIAEELNRNNVIRFSFNNINYIINFNNNN